MVQNNGNDRVIDLLRDWLVPGSAVDVMSSALSILRMQRSGSYSNPPLVGCFSAPPMR